MRICMFMFYVDCITWPCLFSYGLKKNRILPTYRIRDRHAWEMRSFLFFFNFKSISFFTQDFISVMYPLPLFFPNKVCSVFFVVCPNQGQKIFKRIQQKREYWQKKITHSNVLQQKARHKCMGMFMFMLSVVLTRPCCFLLLIGKQMLLSTDCIQ